MFELNREFLIAKYESELNLLGLTEIKIWCARIRKIDPNSFKGLTKLERLELGFNGIEEIEEKTFENLSNLKYLSLHRNQLKKIDADTFKGLTKLEKLFLYNNQIKEIDQKAFESLKNLKWLSLGNNNLEEIDRKCFEPLKSIEVIILYENYGLTALSFIKPLIECSYNESKVNDYGYMSDWNKFLQQFPDLGNIFQFVIITTFTVLNLISTKSFKYLILYKHLQRKRKYVKKILTSSKRKRANRKRISPKSNIYYLIYSIFDIFCKELIYEKIAEEEEKNRRAIKKSESSIFSNFFRFFGNSNTPFTETKDNEKKLQDPYIGLIINERFEVVRKLGKGSFGSVYLVNDTKIDSRYNKSDQILY